MLKNEIIKKVVKKVLFIEKDKCRFILSHNVETKRKVSYKSFRNIAQILDF